MPLLHCSPQNPTMKNRLLFSTIILVLKTLVGLCDSSTTTFELRFDGILPSRARRDETHTAGGESREPYSALDVSVGIAIGILQEYDTLAESRLGSEVIENQERQCFGDDSRGGSSWCFVHGSSNDSLLSLQVTMHVPKDASTRIDVSLTAVDANVVRESLVQAVPDIRDRFETSSVGNEPIWTIRHRPNALEVKTTTATHQEERYTQAGSIENIILGNAEMKNRVQLEHTFVQSPNNTRTLIELWQYNDEELKEPVKSLFVNGILQTTTSPAGAAHAEALVHPALIAHPNPKNVAVISRTPSAVVREVLKHKSIERVSVIGADKTALDMVQRNMPSQTDCSFLRTNDANCCLNQASVEMVNSGLTDWVSSCQEEILRKENASTCFYDVILVDVPIGTSEWLSPDLYDDIDDLYNEAAVVVISSGSQPRLVDASTGSQMSARDTLLYQASRKEAHGGVEFPAILIYDEPLAQPLSSTYMALFYDNEEKTYTRFVRKNSPAIDIDIVNRLHAPIASQPTVVYDGPTHKGYMITSRAWENWFCKTSPWKLFPICEFTKNWMDPSYHHLGVEVRQDPVKGRTVYATEDIPKDHFVNSIDAAKSWRLERDLLDALIDFVDEHPEAEMYRNLVDYLQAYGFTQRGLGIDGFGVSVASVSTFINHACFKKEESIVGLRSAEVDGDGEEVAFSPPYARRPEVIEQLTVASRDIHVGEEILQDYSSFRVKSDKEYKEYLRKMCESGVGMVVDRDSDDNKSTCTT